MVSLAKRAGMDLPDGWTTGTLRANGIDVHYYRAGNPDGRPIVLAHGYTDDGRCWEPLADDLAAEYDLLMYDARGHGRSDAPAEGYAIADRVADLVGVVEGLELADPILLGHSMGGSTVANAAATHPDLASALVLEDPAGLLPEVRSGDGEAKAREVAADVERWRTASLESIAAEYAGRGPHLSRVLARARAACSPHITAVAREGFPDPEAVYPDVEVPTLVLKADADEATRAQNRDALAGLEDGRLVHVPDAGHCVFRDEYDAAVAELAAFLERV